MAAVDDYFAGLDGPARTAFERVRVLAEEQAPDAEQGTSYGMAALRLRGKPLLGFKAAKEHLSVFPFSPAAVDAVRDRSPASRRPRARSASRRTPRCPTTWSATWSGSGLDDISG